MAGHAECSLSHTLDRLILWLSPRILVKGIPVHAAFPSQAARAVCFAKVETALGLISRYDPVRFRRLERDVTPIVVWPAGSFAGSLNAVTRICLLNRRVVDSDRGGIATATVLVHEAMHARLVRLGIRSRDRSVRQRRRGSGLASGSFRRASMPVAALGFAVAPVAGKTSGRAS
jgi:hypothetical protein